MEWHFFDDDLNAAWKEVTAQPADPSGAASVDDETAASERGPPSVRYLYELLGGMVLLYGVLVYLLWQQALQRFDLLEAEVADLRSEIAAWTQAEAAAPAVSTARPASGTVPFQLESAHLQIASSTAMATTVQAVAPRVDAKVLQFYRDFGLPIPAEKPWIIVDLPINSSDHLRVADPLIARHPRSAVQRHGGSEADALTTQLSSRLSWRLLEQAIDRHAIKSQWWGMTLALKTHVHLENGYNPEWRRDALFLEYRHAAQDRSLVDVHESINVDALRYEHEFLYTADVRSVKSLEVHPAAYATAIALVDFILATYGDAKIAELLPAFAVHETWETLAPALFHLSAAEFEEQWQRYLRQHYPIPE